jgi:hypothetical protein
VNTELYVSMNQLIRFSVAGKATYGYEGTPATDPDGKLTDSAEKSLVRNMIVSLYCPVAPSVRLLVELTINSLELALKEK